MAKLNDTRIYGDLSVDGEIKNKASLATDGVVKLNNTISSTSITEAATANAVKQAYDKANHSHPYASTSVATASANGLMSSGDKTKLDGIATGANKTVLNNTVTSTSTAEAATANAVKTAYDKANHSHPYVPLSNGGGITIHADSDASTTTEYFMAKAGHNELKVTSSGGGTAATTKGQDKLTFNDNAVYHVGNKPTKADVGLGNVANYGVTTDINSTSTTTYATASAVKQAYDLAAGKANASHTHNYLPLTGGTITGDIFLQKGAKVHACSAGQGSDGYINIATITISRTYQNQPFKMSVIQRERFGTLIIKFASVNYNDPDLTYIQYTGNVQAYIRKSATSTWDLYIKKEEIYDYMEISNLYKGTYTNGVNIQWKDIFVATLPTGYISAALYTVSVGGNSATATKLQTARTINGVAFDGTTNITIADSTKVAPTGTIVANRVPVFNDTTGKVIKDSGYTIASSVPSGAKFTDTVYTHPSNAGNKHIPSGGSSGQILRWSADGTAVWGADSNTTYALATTSSNGLMSAADKTKLDGIATGANKTVLNNTVTSTSTTEALSAAQGKMLNDKITSKFEITREDLSGQKIDLNTLNLSTGTVTDAYYIVKTTSGSSNITNIPVKEPFTLDVKLVRYASNTDYVTQQVFTLVTSKSTYERFCTSGIWSSWLPNTRFTGTPASGQVVVSDGIDGGVKTTGYTIASSVPGGAKFTDTVYTHPTTSGNKHIPSGGSSGQILRWSADGTAVWGADSNTTYGVATASTNGLMSSGDKTKLDGIATGANKTVLNNTITSTSTSEAATANAVKTAYDKANHSHPYAPSSHTHSDLTNLVSRGYLQSNTVSDVNKAVTNGKYKYTGSLNVPSNGTWLIDVTVEPGGRVAQLATCVYGADDGKLFTRRSQNDLTLAWEAWKQIATTSSTVANADTVDGKHASDFLQTSGAIATDLHIGGNNCYIYSEDSAESFCFRGGSSKAGWGYLTIKSDGAYVNAGKVYHTGNRPTAGDIGAVPNSGGDISGNLGINGKLYTKINGVATDVGLLLGNIGTATTFTCTPYAGITLESQYNCRLGNIVFVSFKIANFNYTANNLYSIGSVPSQLKPASCPFGIVLSSRPGVDLFPTQVTITKSGSIYFSTASTIVAGNSIIASGVYIL